MQFFLFLMLVSETVVLMLLALNANPNHQDSMRLFYFFLLFICAWEQKEKNAKESKRTQKEKKEEIFCDVPVSHKHKNKIKRISLQTYGALDAPHDLIDRSNLTTTKLPLLSWALKFHPWLILAIPILLRVPSTVIATWSWSLLVQSLFVQQRSYCWNESDFLKLMILPRECEQYQVAAVSYDSS